MSNRGKRKLHDYVYYNYIYIYINIYDLIEFYGDRYRCDNVLFLIKCVLYHLWQKYLRKKRTIMSA